jgi:hypothetical protein
MRIFRDKDRVVGLNLHDVSNVLHENVYIQEMSNKVINFICSNV